MATEIKKSTSVKTPMFRCAYVHVFEPQVFEDDEEKTEDGKPKKPVYTVQAIFPPDADLTELKAMCDAAAKKKFGRTNVKMPFRKGCEEEFPECTENRPEILGCTVVNLKSYNRQPQVCKAIGKGLKQLITDKDEFYSGCWAVATVGAWAYDHKKGGKGVSIMLNNLMKMKDDEPLSAVRRAETDFAEIEPGDYGVETNASEFDDMMG